MPFGYVNVCDPDGDAFLLTVRFGTVSRYGSARIRYENDCMCMIGPLDSRCKGLALIVGLF